MFQRSVLVTVMAVLSCFLAKGNHNETWSLFVSTPNDIIDDDNDTRSCHQGLVVIKTKQDFAKWFATSTETYDRVKNSTNVCQFAFSYFEAYKEAILSHSYIYPGNISLAWHCEISNTSLCNGYSTCLRDECECSDSPVFYCKDSSGCISFTNVCDGRLDCLDGSDECMCEGRYPITCPNFQPRTYCLKAMDLCGKSGGIVMESLKASQNCILSQKAAGLNCTSVVQEYANLEEEKYGSPLIKCLIYVFMDFLSNGDRDDYIVTRYCKNNCTNNTEFVEEKWDQYCDHIYLGETSLSYHSFNWDYVFNCEPRPYMRKVAYITDVCDGKKDCENGADEMGCPGRFYCSPNSSMDWVSPEQLCDHVKDCPNGQDECGTCDMGALSSSDFLIHSKIVLYSTGFAGLLMVVLNGVVGVECYKSEPANKPGMIDRIMRLQVIFYDSLMGVYNMMIVVAALVLKSRGPYCLSDQSWRSSIYCSSLGVLFSISSHGSLIVIGLMSIVRCLTCTKTVIEVRKSAVLIISAVLFMANLINSLVPVLPFSAVQDIFRSQAFFLNFKNNPFISSGLVNFTRLDELHYQYYSNTTTFYNTVVDLNKISSEEGLFDVIEIGYYGNTRMCTQNIFKSQDSYLIYKLTYLLVIFLIVTAVAFTYLIILYKKVESHRRLKTMGALQNPQREDEIASLKTKIVLMIGSQLISWMSFIVAAAYYQFSSKNPPPMTFEIFSLVVIPINSILNPIFYSGIYRKIQALFSRAWELMITKVGCSNINVADPDPNSNEMEMQEVRN